MARRYKGLARLKFVMCLEDPIMAANNWDFYLKKYNGYLTEAYCLRRHAQKQMIADQQEALRWNQSGRYTWSDMDVILGTSGWTRLNDLSDQAAA